MPARDGLPELRTAEGGVLLKVHATPGSSREGLAGLHGGALKVAVRAPPEKGRANEALLEVVARALDLRVSRLRIQAGATSRGKWILVRDAGLEEVARRLETALKDV